VKLLNDARELVQRRAQHACEYCRLPQDASILPHQVDHIIGRQHRGSDDAANLCLCCIRCNLKKGPNIASIDPEGTHQRHSARPVRSPRTVSAGAPPRRRLDLSARAAVCYASVMLSLKASVRNGRLILDEPTELPEGAVVDLVAIGGDKLDELDDEEREALHAALAEGIAQDDAGDTVDADEVLAHLRARVS
jgi:hypothetical protein